MRIVYIDPIAGLAGDMLLAALIDAGAQRARIIELPQRLGLNGVTVSLRRTRRGALSALQLKVRASADQPHRNLADLRRIVKRADLPAGVKDNAIKVFTALATAEAKVHGVPIERVHFHEVGAADALIDVVGAALALDLLGAQRVYCGALPLGSGTVRCAHGLLPVPAPATVELLRGLPVLSDSRLPGERVTPTGAALAAVLAHEFGPPPRLRLSSVGYGAGSRRDGELPNVTRVLIGDELETAQDGHDVVLETNVDDMNPQLCETLNERLLAAGVHDVFYAPVTMKKGRPGLWIHVVCDERTSARAIELLLSESTTLGVRSYRVQRATLHRKSVQVETEYGRLSIKLGLNDAGRVLNAHPEFSECKAAAERCNAPVKLVIQAALSAYYHRPRSRG